jgi:phosphoglycolate phosphatase-like HAD superfamily hydrolase
MNKILFDLDGTIIDSKNGFFHCFNQKVEIYNKVML